jgi:hypothetical protein
MARPEISDEVKQEVERVTDDYFRVPSHRVTFEDRLKVLLEQAQAAVGEPEGADLGL